MAPCSLQHGQACGLSISVGEVVAILHLWLHLYNFVVVDLHDLHDLVIVVGVVHEQ